LPGKTTGYRKDRVKQYPVLSCFCGNRLNIFVNCSQFIRAMKYISLLRGINVSGKNIIKMDVLKSLFENIGAQNVKTYIQSGNVVFEHLEADSKILAKKIAGQIYFDFGMEIPVLVLSKQKLEQVVTNNPFTKDKTKDPTFFHVTFLDDKPIAGDKETILANKSAVEEIVFSDEAVYLYCPEGYGRTKLNNNFLENKLKVQATTRNWKTTITLLEMAAD